MTVCVLDLGVGNLRSVRAALERAGAAARIGTGADDLAGARLVVLPGVGAAAPAMATIRERGLDSALRAALAAGARLFGICVGMQVLFERSSEGVPTACLGLLPGSVTRLEHARRLPHMGWNDVAPAADHPLAGPLPAVCYFANSYAVQDAPPEVVVGITATEGGPFASLVASGPVAGAQFHPERSGRAGAEALRAVLAWADAA